MTPRDQRDALVGLSAPVGAVGTFMVSYLRKTDKAVANANAHQVAIGYTHNLSKRTTLYTSYGHINVNDVNKFGLGIRHKF